MPKETLFIPGPVAVSPAVLAACSRPLVDHRGPHFAALLERVERHLQPIFGTPNDVVLLGGSGTSGLEAAIASVFGAGDRLLAAPVGVFGRRLIAIARMYGCEVEILETPVGAALDPNALAERLRADEKHEITGLLLTQNETSTGVQNDMPALSRAIGEHPALVLVDAVSGLGASDFAMDALRFDIAVAASQKVFAAPPGIAMVAASERAWERMAATKTPRFYLDLQKARDFKRKGQTPWTPPVSIAFAFEVALELYSAAGPQAAWERHARYARAIRAAAGALGLELLSKDGAHSDTVVAIRVPESVDGPAVSRTLRDKFGIVAGGGQAELAGKIFRFGTMGDLRETDVASAMGALEGALAEHGYARTRGAAASAAFEVLSG